MAATVTGMISKRFLAIAVGAALMVNAASCVHVVNNVALSLEEVSLTASTINGKHVAVYGFIIRQPLGGYFLYPDRGSAEIENYSNGLDIVALTQSARAKLEPFADGGCVVVSGVFTHYDENIIVVGNVGSEVGRIDADRITRTKCLPD